MLAAGIQFDLAIEFGKRAIHANAQVALRTQSIEYRGVISLAALNDGRKQRKRLALRLCEHCIHHLADRLRIQWLTVGGAVRCAHPSKQQAKVVVHLRNRANRGARVVGRRFLLDGDGW